MKYIRGLLHLLIAGLSLLLLVPLIVVLTRSELVALWLGGGAFIAYWVVVATWKTRQIKLFELIIVAAVLGILAALVVPAFYDPTHRSYLERSQSEMIENSDLVILTEARNEGGIISYRLREVWRNRRNTAIPWGMGEEVADFRAQVNNHHAPASEKIAFYRRETDGLKWLGSLHAYSQDGIRLRIDIGARNRLQRWLNTPVSISEIKRYIQRP